MKKNTLFSLFFFFGLYGCHSSIAPNEDVTVLHERFHGVYKPIQVIANEAVDINLDGKASTDLMNEMLNLESTQMQLNIISNNQSLFTQFWQEQYLSKRGESIDGPIDYSPDIFVNYAKQPVFGSCYFNQQLTAIILAPEKNPVLNPIHWPRPESIKIVGVQRIQVVNRRQLYTRAGWKTVTITTLYERYLKTT